MPELWTSQPSPALVPSISAPTSTKKTNPAAIRTPTKMDGMAEGRATLNRMVFGAAPRLRAVLSSNGSVLTIPTLEKKSTGQVATHARAAILTASPEPNISKNTGSNENGLSWLSTRRNGSNSLRQLASEWPSSVPTKTPNVSATPNPASTRSRLVHTCSSSAPRTSRIHMVPSTSERVGRNIRSTAPSLGNTSQSAANNATGNQRSHSGSLVGRDWELALRIMVVVSIGSAEERLLERFGRLGLQEL